MRLRIFLLFMGVLFLLSVVPVAVKVVNERWSARLPVYAYSESPSEYHDCPNARAQAYTSEAGVFVRDASEYGLEPLVDTPFYRKIGTTSEDMELYSIPDNNDFVIARSKFGFQPEIYRSQSAPPILLADLRGLEVKEVVFSDFEHFYTKRLWSSKDPALIEDILQTLDQPWQQTPEPWKTRLYRVDLLSDRFKNLSYYMIVEANVDGQFYLDSYERPAFVAPVGDLFFERIQKRGKN